MAFIVTHSDTKYWALIAVKNVSYSYDKLQGKFAENLIYILIQSSLMNDRNR